MTRRSQLLRRRALDRSAPRRSRRCGYATVLERPTKRGAASSLEGDRRGGRATTSCCPARIAFELPDELEIDLARLRGASRRRSRATTPRSRLLRARLRLRDVPRRRGRVPQHERPLRDRPRRVVLRVRRGGTRRSSSPRSREVTGVRPTVKRGRIIHVYLFSLQWARLLAQFGKRDEKHLPASTCAHDPLLSARASSTACSTVTGTRRWRAESASGTRSRAARRALRRSLPPPPRQLPEASSVERGRRGRARRHDATIVAATRSARASNLTPRQARTSTTSTSSSNSASATSNIGVAGLRHRGRLPDAQLHRRQRRSCTTRSARPASSPASACRRSRRSTTSPKSRPRTACR